MYTEKELQDLRTQKRKRWIILGAVSLILLACVIAAFIMRQEILTDVMSILLGANLIFSYEMFIKPIRDYMTHVDNALHGHTREINGAFKGVSEDVSVVDGVNYHALTVLIEPDDEEPYDRLFYYDVLKPALDFELGTDVHIVFHDKEIVSIQSV